MLCGERLRSRAVDEGEFAFNAACTRPNEVECSVDCRYVEPTAACVGNDFAPLCEARENVLRDVFRRRSIAHDTPRDRDDASVLFGEEPPSTPPTPAL